MILKQTVIILLMKSTRTKTIKQKGKRNSSRLESKNRLSKDTQMEVKLEVKNVGSQTATS